jgi:hypothetical protein
MDNQNHSRNDANENQTKHLAKLVIVLEKYFTKWIKLPGSNQVSKGQIAVYAEALIDLNPEALEFGCAEAMKMAERFPWPGHIRKAAEGYRKPDDRSGMLGARGLEWNPELERQRIERMNAFEKNLESGAPPEEPLETKTSIGATRHAKSIEEQKEELKKRGYLQ